ncbi:hypothetical protein BP5796_12858 [Coleophoma crateriformis]|uniref:NmrA-like domain-containing protein n=1 Tax=Coleophoma crateriformis TaxID=565419 RepID=A0A3D8Q4P0_9HELO|nr:hypothetical protein BP5796_12858 [Coleophoma crateriformis]
MTERKYNENLLLFGATGSIGAFILDKLIENKKHFGSIAIFTSPGTIEKKADKIQQLKANGIKVISGDVRNPNEVTNAFEGVDTVISAIGRNVITEQINWIHLADQVSSVERFFPSEFGTDIEYGPESAHEIPNQQKLKVRAALKEATNLHYTYVVTGPYAQAEIPAFLGALPSAPEIGSFNVMTKTAVLIGDGTAKISLTTPSDVGKLVVQALLHPDVSRNRALKVNSFTTTPKEILEEFEKQLGETWTVKYTSFDELRRLETNAWNNKHPMAPIFTLRRIWSEGGTLYDKRDNALIDGEDMETLADAVKAAISTQKSDSQDAYKDRKLM